MLARRPTQVPHCPLFARPRGRPGPAHERGIVHVRICSVAFTTGASMRTARGGSPRFSEASALCSACCSRMPSAQPVLPSGMKAAPTSVLNAQPGSAKASGWEGCPEADRLSAGAKIRARRDERGPKRRASASTVQSVQGTASSLPPSASPETSVPASSIRQHPGLRPSSSLRGPSRARQWGAPVDILRPSRNPYGHVPFVAARPQRTTRADAQRQHRGVHPIPRTFPCSALRACSRPADTRNGNQVGRARVPRISEPGRAPVCSPST